MENDGNQWSTPTNGAIISVDLEFVPLRLRSIVRFEYDKSCGFVL